jgi:hypothetical protein
MLAMDPALTPIHIHSCTYWLHGYNPDPRVAMVISIWIRVYKLCLLSDQNTSSRTYDIVSGSYVARQQQVLGELCYILYVNGYIGRQ